MLTPGSTHSFTVFRILFKKELGDDSQGNWLLFITLIILSPFYIMLGHIFNSAEAVNHGTKAGTVQEVWEPLRLPLSSEKCRAEP